MENFYIDRFINLKRISLVVALEISLPKTMGSLGAENMSVSFNASQIAMMAAIILALAFLYVLLVAVVSVFARTVKKQQPM